MTSKANLSAQQSLLRRILRENARCSLFNQMGLQRLGNFKDFEALYQGFCRAVPVQGPRVFFESLGKMLPQSNLTPLQILQSPNLLMKGKPLAATNWRGVTLPVTAGLLGDHLDMERQLKRIMATQGIMTNGRMFYLFEQEVTKQDMGEDVDLSVPLRGWHELLEGQRWFWEKNKVNPKREGLPAGGSRWQWFNAMLDQMRLCGSDVEILVASPRTLIDFGLYVSQQVGRFMPLKEFMPQLKVIVLNHYDIGLQRTEIGYLLGGLPHVRWLQWVYAPLGFQAMQGDINIRQKLDMQVNGSVFYEFVPLEDIDPSGRFNRNFRRLHIGQVAGGQEYNLVVSSMSGLLGISTGMSVRVVNVDPFQIVTKGPIVQLNGLGEGVREEAVLDALSNINSALAGHGVFVREALLGHIMDERLPFWVLEVSRPIAELQDGVLDSIAKRLHAELNMRCERYRNSYRGGAFKPPSVNFVPMGTFAAAFTSSPEFSQFDHSLDASLCKRVLNVAWETRQFEGV